MKRLKLSVILLALLLAAMAMVPMVSAVDNIDAALAHDVSSGSLDINKIQLPQLQFDASQKKVIVTGELSPDESVQGSELSEKKTKASVQTASKIPFGSIIYHSKDGVTTVFDSMGNQLFAADDAKAVNATTPHGESLATFVHEIPSGSIVKRSANTTYVFYQGNLILTLINDAYDYSASQSTEFDHAQTAGVKSITPGGKWLGWIEYARSAPNTITRFEATWNAPTTTPSNSGVRESLAIFNGIESDGINCVMQPVLMWNFCEPGDLNLHLYYTGAAWDYVAGRSADQLHSTPISVSPGDSVRGRLQWSSSYNMWWVVFDNLRTGQSTTYYGTELSTSNLHLETCLEATGVGIKTNDQSLPGSITFSNMIFQNNGNNIAVTLGGQVWPGASNYFNNLGAFVYDNSHTVLLRTNR